MQIHALPPTINEQIPLVAENGLPGTYVPLS